MVPTPHLATHVACPGTDPDVARCYTAHCMPWEEKTTELTTRSAPAGHEKQENNDSTKQGPSMARQSVVEYQQSGVLQGSKSEGELTGKFFRRQDPGLKIM